MWRVGAIGRASALCVTLLALWGCQVSPEDRSTVGLRSEAIDFWGFALRPGPVRVQAQDPATGQFAVFATEETSSQPSFPIPALPGLPVYHYRVASAVPAFAWVPGTRGHAARVRALDASGTPISSLRPHGAPCAVQVTTPEELLSCQAGHSKDIWIMTEEFRDDPQASIHVVRKGLVWETQVATTSIVPPREVLLLLQDTDLPGRCELSESGRRVCPHGVAGGSTTVPLVRDGKPTAFATWSSEERLVQGRTLLLHTISTRVPVWKPGEQFIGVLARFGVSGPDVADAVTEQVSDAALRSLHRGRVGFRHAAGRDFIELPDLPARVADCQGMVCPDVDEDGLLDAWENLILHFSRPTWIFDENEDLFSAPRHDVAVFSSVRPSAGIVRGDGSFTPTAVRAVHYLAQSRDFGAPVLGAGGHVGDVSQAAVELRLEQGAGDASRAVLSRLFTRGHTGVRRANQTYDVPDAAVEMEPSDQSPRVYVEEDKHGTWWSVLACDALGTNAYHCGDAARGGRYRIRPIATEIGTAAHPRVDRVGVASNTSHLQVVRWWEHLGFWQVVQGQSPLLELPFQGREAVWGGDDHPNSDDQFCGGALYCDGNSPGKIGPGSERFDPSQSIPACSFGCEAPRAFSG